MTGFIYMIAAPEHALATRDDVRRAGLAGVLPAHQATRDMDRCIVAHPDLPMERFRVAPDAQEWRDWGPGVTFGWWRDAPPTHLSLERNDYAAPTALVLTAHGELTVPILRGIEGALALPRLLLWSEGRWNATIQTRYARLESLLLRLWFDLLSGYGVPRPDDAAPLTWEEQAEIAREALGMTYRVAEPELTALEWLDERTLARVLSAVVDAPALARLAAEWSVET